MPEIKSAFTRGTMNKDLDERLIPSGNYRDAVNVNVTTSDEGGAGTARNLLGNTRVDALLGGQSYTCVGSIANERTNKLYWFVHNPVVKIDAILEYDKVQDISQIILADAYSSAEFIAENSPLYTPFYGENYDYSRILNFTGKQITGINIVDDFLFWSDGDDEPKKINISRSYHDGYTALYQGVSAPGGTYAFVPRLHVNGELTDTILHKDHITVIKKKPTSAPTVKLISAKGEAGSAIFEKVFLRFCTRYKYADGQYSAFGPFTDVVFNPEHNDLINSVNAYSTDEPYNKSMVNLIKSVELYDFISPDMPADVVQVDILYKQEDSTAIYSIENIKINSAEANHAGSGQFNVDGAESSYKGKYEVTSENIHAVLPENQLLRPFDVVPKSALGQEIVGNRLVYANYKQGYSFTDSIPTIDAYKINRPSQDFFSGGLKSLKSQRKYQLGYVLGDKYGRETPVFTSRQGGVDVPWYSNESYNASASTMLKTRLYGSFPEWVDYYKFYVKSSSDEYYNLLMDRSYFPFTHNEFVNKDDHIYISFPSSDRNKIVEDDYIIAKKIYDSNNAQIPFENKYKILDISNEAPDAVKYVFFSLGSVENSSASNILCSGSGDFGSNSLFPGPDVAGKGGKRIDQQVDTIHMSANGWVSSNVDGSRLTDPDNEYDKDVYISWNVGNIFSNRYKVTSIDVSSNNNDYVLKLSTKISEKDAKLAAFNDTISASEFKLDPGLIFRCERRETRGEEDFSGKFFVKIKHNDYLTGNDQSDDVYPVSSAESYWLFGQHTTTGNPSEGIINSASSSISNTLEGAVTVANSPNMNVDGFANTALEWSSIKSHIGDAFFIDDMNFVATNVRSESYAKEAGKASYNSKLVHQPFEWGPLFMSASEYEDVFGELPGTTFEELNPGFEDGDDLYGWKWNGFLYSFEQFTNRELSFKSWAPLAKVGVGSTNFDTGVYASRIYNSFEGIVTSTSDHVFTPGTLTTVDTASREFRVGSIYADSLTSYGYPSSFYGDTPGRQFIHISFLAPGEDLIDPLTSDDLVGVTIRGRDSIASKLQGIWGGGAFHKIPAQSSSVEYDFDSFGELPDHEGNVVEFEGNYAPNSSSFGGLPPTASLNAAAGPGVGQGYDLDYQTKHQQQWNPAYGSSNPAEIEEFVNRLKTPGQKFKFKGDTDNTVYTIVKCSELHVYNHTSWRAIWLPNADGSAYELAGNSVEEAASAWADFTDANLTPSNNSGDEGYSTAATALADRITDFGSASNRRTTFIVEVDKDFQLHYDPRFGTNDIDATDSTDIEFITTLAPSSIDSIFSSPTIWETEPQQLTDLNVYYEASNNIPTKITSATNELFAPVGSQIKGINSDDSVYISEWTSATKFKTNIEVPEGDNYIGSTFQFCRQDDSYVEAVIIGQEGQDVFEIEEDVRPDFPVGLSWFNCFSFGDGIESDRIRDGYNKMRLSSGARVSAVLEEPFIEEHRTNGLIYSGIYNSNSNVNNLNQFIAAEKITKDINPTYGSIQKLFTRNTDLVALCEDRIIKILANKDAVFNADGNPQLVATPNVLGQSIPFVGDYGISTHPESFASDTFRAYFTDKQRGAVLRLSMDGLTPISESGMRDYFRDNLVDEANFIGSYDRFNQQYNLTIKKEPIIENVLNDDFSEGVAAVESPNNTEYIDDGTFTQGVDFSGVVQLEDLDLVERNKTINPDLFVDVTIRNHPAIDVLVPSVDITEPQTTFNPDQFIVHPNGLELMLFDTNHLTSQNPFGDNGVGDFAKYTIKRFNNTTWHQDQPLEGNIQEYNGYNGENFDLPIGDGTDTGINGSDDYGEWMAPSVVFVSTGEVPYAGNFGTGSGEIGNFFNASETNNYEAINPGMTFRGSPWGGPSLIDGTPNPSMAALFGAIVFPEAGFTQGSDLYVSEDLPAGTEVNTCFKGEQIRVTVNYRANNYGSFESRTNFIKLILLDGSDSTPVDSALFELPDEVNSGDGHYIDEENEYLISPAASGPSNEDPNPQTTTSGSLTYPHSISEYTTNTNGEEGVHDVDGEMVFCWKFATDYDPSAEGGYPDNVEGTNVGEVAVQNLKFRIEVWNNKASASADELEDLGETVITGFKFEKLRRLINQDSSTTQDVVIGQTDPIPLEPIPAWAEVIFPTTVEGYQQIHGIDYSSIFSTFGFQNLAEEISYLDGDGNEQTYLSGQSNGVTSYNEYTGVEVANENYTQHTHALSARLTTFATGLVPLIINLDETKLPLANQTWYLLEIELPDEIDFSTIGDFELPFIQLLDSSNQPQGLFTANTDGLQIGSVDGDKLTLELIDNKLTALFKIYAQNQYGLVEKISLSTFSYPGIFIPGVGASPSLMESIRFTDVSVESTGGFADNWDINPNLYQIQRAAIPGTTTIPQSHPSVYYQNGQMNFNSSFQNVIASTFANERSFTQHLPDLPEVNDHYELVVEYGNDAISGSFNSNENAKIKINIGDHEFYNPVVMPDSGTNFHFHSPINFDGGPAEIKFTADNQFIGSVKSVSLKDMTNYFSAGSVGSWIIEGFDQEVENFISWYQGQISFNAASTGHRIYQQIGELPVGQSFELSFDLAYTTISLANSGTVKVSYINEAGLVAFENVFSFLDQGDVNHLFYVSEGSGTPLGYSNTFIIEASGSNPLIATIDNLKLRRVITDEEFGAAVTTVSYKESVKGWVSFKSFVPENGLSLSSQYFTFQHGQLWQHDTNDVRNNFYGIHYDSSITTIINQSPSIIKSFDTVNYEGSEDWVLSYINTDLDQGAVNEFVKKENKWFNYIKGTPGSFDTSRLNVQGLGFISHTTED